MEINFILKDLKQKLQNMFTLAKGTEREILTNVLLTANNSAILGATDGRLIQGHVDVGAKIIAQGSVLLPPEFLNFIKVLKDQSQAANIRVEDNIIYFTCGSTEATFSVADTRQYPSLLDYPATPHEVDSSKFMLALKTLATVAGKEPYDMLYFNSENGVLTMGATDNFRLAFFDMACDLKVVTVQAIMADVIPALMALGESKKTGLGFEHSGTLSLACADYRFRVATTGGLLNTNVLRFYDAPDGKPFNVGQLLEKTKAAGAIDENVNLDLKGHLQAQSSRANYEDTFECQPQTGQFLVNIKHLEAALRLPYDSPIIGVKLIGSRQLLHIRDNAMQQYLVPLENV